jgi:septin family protein
MVCGAAGIGKTSFVKLFLKKFNHHQAEEIIKGIGTEYLN